jgi:hypothetical protein
MFDRGMRTSLFCKVLVAMVKNFYNIGAKCFSDSWHYDFLTNGIPSNLVMGPHS